MQPVQPKQGYFLAANCELIFCCSFFAGIFRHAATPKVLANHKTALLVFPSKKCS
jgi:hypothetical protein